MPCEPLCVCRSVFSDYLRACETSPEGHLAKEPVGCMKKGLSLAAHYTPRSHRALGNQGSDSSSLGSACARAPHTDRACVLRFQHAPELPDFLEYRLLGPWPRVPESVSPWRAYTSNKVPDDALVMAQASDFGIEH